MDAGERRHRSLQGAGREWRRLIESFKTGLTKCKYPHLQDGEAGEKPDPENEEARKTKAFRASINCHG
jgi:hypothetical protein